MPNIKNVLPTQKMNGSYEDQETVLRTCDCGCGRPTAYYVKTGEVCYDQTMELRGNDTGVLTMAEFEQALAKMDAADLLALLSLLSGSTDQPGSGSIFGGSFFRS